MMLQAIDFASLKLSLRLATTTTLILLLLGCPLANWLATTKTRCKCVLEAITALPLVLPPTVLGLYLLMLLGANGVVSKITGHSLAFSFTGLLIGSVIYSFPFVVQPLQNAIEAIGSKPLELATTLGAGPLDRFFTIKLPLIKRGIITAIVLGFTHTLGEFGVVLMIGGNIPGKTQLISMDIYNNVELFHYHKANVLAAILVIFSFASLVIVYGYNYKDRRLRI